MSKHTYSSITLLGGYGEKSTNRVKNPRVGWANSMGRGDGGAVERDEINAWGLLNMLHATRG